MFERLSEYTISLRSTLRMILEIKSWLIEEYDKTGEGFYCNWRVIQSSFNDKELVTINFNKRPIGFACWSIAKKIAVIEILEIEPQFRGKVEIPWS
jgi:hypothetical protein